MSIQWAAYRPAFHPRHAAHSCQPPHAAAANHERPLTQRCASPETFAQAGRASMPAAHVAPAPLVVPAYREIARQGLAGLALAMLFGAAVGIRYGVASMLLHAVGTPLALFVVVTVVVPSLYVALTFSGWSLPIQTMTWLCARALSSSGVLLAGMSPAVVMLTASFESDFSVGLLAAAGLATAGALTMRHIVSGVRLACDGQVRQGSVSVGSLTLRSLLFLLFYVVGGTTALRIWWLALPALGGS